MSTRRNLTHVALVLIFCAAYWPGGPWLTNSPPLLERFEYWFFDSQGSSAGLVGIVAAWMAWRRRRVLFRDAETHSLIVTGLLFLFALVILAWARLNEAPDLLFLSLAFLLAALSFQGSGMRGIRRMTLPIVSLLFALPIPSPLSNEILWTLQNWSAAWTAHALRLLGFDILQSGAHLTRGDVHFLVIEGCSGLRSILTLTLVSLVIRELLGTRGFRGALLVLLAPPLAVALNIVRISTIILRSTRSEQDMASTHLEQGLVVLAIGTIVLFVVGHFLAADRTIRDGEESESPFDRRSLPLKPVALMGVTLLVASIAIRPWPSPASSETGQATKIDLPWFHAGWQGKALELDYPFLGLLPRGQIERRLYQLTKNKTGNSAVELSVATDSDSRPRGSPISSKLMVPGRDWQINRSISGYNWVLGREIRVLHDSSTETRALVYAWSIHDGGFWIDSLRSLLALERGPFARRQPRYMITLAVEMGGEPEAELHARQILDRFVYDFNRAFRQL